MEFYYSKLDWMRISNLPTTKIYRDKSYIRDLICENVPDILNGLYTEKLQLFIPVTIVFLIVVWFFNDKIKAR